MKKSLWISIAITGVVLAIGAWYLFAPAFQSIEADDPDPLNDNVIMDAMTTMTEEELMEFEEAVAAMGDQVIVMEETMPQGAQLLAEGDFKPRAHGVEGKALLIDDGFGQKILRFEDFETINGPNLHIYLASSLSDEDFIDLGEIRATSGNVNYDIPQGIDTDQYDKVLVWCVPFGVLFSYAELE